MTKRRSIFDGEHSAKPIKADAASSKNPKKSRHLPSKKLLAQIARDARNTLPPDPKEMIWTGGRAPFDLNAELNNDLDDITALDDILLAIIGSHCSVEFPPEEGSVEAKKIRRRLEQAKRFLLDRPARQGAPSEIKRELVWKIAEEFWHAYATQADEEMTLASIAANVVMPNWRRHGCDPKDVENETRPYVDAFKRDRDRLLLRVSGAGLQEIEDRKPTVQKVIKLLGDLGIVAPAHASSRRK